MCGVAYHYERLSRTCIGLRRVYRYHVRNACPEVADLYAQKVSPLFNSKPPETQRLACTTGSLTPGKGNRLVLANTAALQPAHPWETSAGTYLQYLLAG